LKDAEGGVANVFLLDDDEDVREAMGELIATVVGGCVKAGSVLEMKSRAREALGCSLALLDINLGNGQPSGLDACAWLHTSGFAGRIAFITGHGHAHPLVRQAEALGNIKVFSKPLETTDLIALVRSSL
jgi:FixJ family two-component response regulator